MEHLCDVRAQFWDESFILYHADQSAPTIRTEGYLCVCHHCLRPSSAFNGMSARLQDSALKENSKLASHPDTDHFFGRILGSADSVLRASLTCRKVRQQQPVFSSRCQPSLSLGDTEAPRNTAAAMTTPAADAFSDANVQMQRPCLLWYQHIQTWPPQSQSKTDL